jgi:hypothetical protein
MALNELHLEPPIPEQVARLFVARSVVQSVGHTSERPGWSHPKGGLQQGPDRAKARAGVFITTYLFLQSLAETESHTKPEMSRADQLWQPLLETVLAPAITHLATESYLSSSFLVGESAAGHTG